jgi:hypothetical protein
MTRFRQALGRQVFENAQLSFHLVLYTAITTLLAFAPALNLGLALKL